MPKIFISYRRDDSAAHSGRLYDRLEGHFGQGQVFMDVDAIKPGLDFVEVVQQAVNGCDGLIAVIGREWLDTSDRAGGRRLDDPEDLVRLEIATALERGIRVIPVLVQGALMPRGADLPDGLKELASRNALELSDARFRADVERLIEALEEPAQAISTPLPEPRSLQPLIGRDRERDTLRARLDAAIQGQGGLVFITGEAGIGKTRMAAELRAYASDRGCQWLEGRYEKEGSIPLQPYVEAVRAYLRTATQGALVDAVGPYAAELGGAFPEIADRLGSTPTTPEPAQDDPETARQRQAEARCFLFTSIARQAPLVLFLDDLQWAPSMDVLRALAQEAVNHPLLLVGAYRDVELRENPSLSRSVLSMNRDRLFVALPLHRLGRQEVEHMVAQALGQTSSQQLMDLLYQRTEGNPFFTEELVRYLVESDALSLQDYGWDVRDTASLQMPDSVKLLVEERLDRLEDATRQALSMASVIGQEFDLAVLLEVTGADEEALVDAVDQAVEARVLVPRSGVGQEVYAFADNQVREVLYQGTGTARRRRYHLRVGEAIEKVHARRLADHYDALAHHFLEGNDLEKATDYSIKAGDLAYGKATFPRARLHYQVAAELLEEPAEESDRAAHVQAQLGTRLITGVIMGEAASEGTQRDIDHIKRAIEMFGNLGNPRRAAVLHRSLAAAYNSGSGVARDYDEAMRHYQAAVDLMAGEEDSLEKAVAYDGLAQAIIPAFELDRAEAMAREALRIAEAIGNPDAMTLACTELGLVLIHQGHLSEGLSYLERAWTSAQQARTPWFRERATAYSAHNIWLGEQGHYQRWFARWEELHRQFGTRRYEANMAGIMAAVSVRCGDPGRGRIFLTRLDEIGGNPNYRMHGVARAMLGEWDMAYDAFVTLDWTGIEPVRLPALQIAPYYGQLFLDRGEAQRAEELLQPQQEYCRERGCITMELNLLPPLITSYIRLGRSEAARTYLKRAREILAMPEDWKGLAAGIHLAEALLAGGEERWPEAEEGFQMAVETNQRHGLVYDQGRSLYEWAVMYLERSILGPSTGSGRRKQEDRNRGIELLDQALELFQRCDAKKDIERIIARKEELAA